MNPKLAGGSRVPLSRSAAVVPTRPGRTAVGWLLGRTLAFLATLLAQPAVAQTDWWGMRTPNGGLGFHCYDPDRDRTVFFDGSATYEYDGSPSGWWTLVSLTSPGLGGTGIAYDRTRRRIVYYEGNTWEWNGLTWTIVAPPAQTFWHLVGHEARGTVVAFGGPNYWNSNDLYEWNGAAWTLLPTTGRPPRPGDFNNSLIYLTAAYDARRDKFVLFGTAMVDWNNFVFSNFQPDLWEWDATSGWVQRVVQQGSITRPSQLFFDSQRGVLTLVSAYSAPVQVAEWDGGSSWQPITTLHALLPTIVGLYPFGGYDDVRGKLYVGLFGSNTYSAAAYGTVTPPQFDRLASGCSGTVGEPVLRLTHNWTRAWLGRSLSVDLTNLPLSAGIVALGWSNQQYGSTTLPLSLTPYGMPGCLARVAPDSVYFVSGTNSTATLSIPVPSNPALLGSVFYQQGWSFDPTANPTGITTSNSVRLTIGRL